MKIPVYVLRSRDNQDRFLAINERSGDVRFGTVTEAYQFNYESLAKHYQEMQTAMNLELCILKYIVIPVNG